MKKTTIYFLISFLAGIITYFLPLGISGQAHIVLSILVTVGVLWLTEAMPIHITSLFIPVLLVIFGQFDLKEVFVPFFDPVVVLLMGGFAMAYALQKYKLDEVIAYFFIQNIGTSPKRFLFAIMIATAFLSMWMSNSATSAVMMPILTIVLVDSGLEKFESTYAKAAVLGVAFAATIGGLSTIVGTTPNSSGFVPGSPTLPIRSATIGVLLTTSISPAKKRATLRTAACLHLIWPNATFIKSAVMPAAPPAGLAVCRSTPLRTRPW